MNDIVTIKIFDAFHDLLQEGDGLFFCEFALLFEVAVEIEIA
jgi:hypothetical protein